MPYILDYAVEEAIYREQLGAVSHLQHVAPHTTYIAALWAVLTRLKRPSAENYEKSVRDVVAALSPLEKADLYALGKVPENVTPEKARELKAAVPDLMAEGEGTSEYEGRRGASPREMKMILLNASQNVKYPSLSPLAVFEELENLVRDPSVFPFLQMKPDGEYHRHDQFINVVEERYLDRIDNDIRDAMGLVESQQYEELFARYVDHVSQSLKGEKVYNRITGTYERPDEDFMAEVEDGLDGDLPDAARRREFRQSIISAIAAYSIDHPGQKVSYQVVFPNFFRSMRRQFFQERQKTIAKILEQILMYFEGEVANLTTAEQSAVETTVNNLTGRYGYNEASAREAVAFLHTNRYKGA